MYDADGDYIMPEANDDVPIDADGDVIMREAIEYDLYVITIALENSVFRFPVSSVAFTTLYLTESDKASSLEDGVPYSADSLSPPARRSTTSSEG